MISEEELNKILSNCSKGHRSSQDRLYKEYYSYGMSISLRYAQTREEALEILNDSFLKVFKKIDKYKYTQGLPFKAWFRKIIINSSIDYFRRNEKHSHGIDLVFVKEQQIGPEILETLSAGEIIEAIQSLPASYRMVFNLYCIEGYKHEEIAEKLQISVGTSKSNLSVARDKLKKKILHFKKEYRSHG